jgi:Platelet-activating factor acetylhydrolase, isoform II
MHQPKSARQLPAPPQPCMHRRAVLGLGVGLVGYWSLPFAQAQALAYADETWQDPRRQRSVPVRIRWPQGAAPAAGWPVVMYSHGLGGSRVGGEVWGTAWAAAGFVVVHLQHAGSDIDAARAVARSVNDRAALRKLGSAEQLLARFEDVAFALDEMARRKTIDKAWRFANLDSVGMAGHSLGAHTTLGVGGESYPNHAGIKERRVVALIAMSPRVPARGDAVQAYAAVSRPTLCVTGTLDGDVMGTGATPERRAAVFGALPAGKNGELKKAMLLLKDADHMTFSGRSDVSRSAESTLPREAVTIELQPQHHALVARVTTDWWRAHLIGHSQAASELVKPAGLGAMDVWRTG